MGVPFALVSIAGLGALLAAGIVMPELRDTEGRLHSPDEWKSKKAIVLEFVETDCPLSNQYVPEMLRLAALYPKIAFLAVLSSPEDGPKGRQYALDFGYKFPVLLDPTQSLARSTGATVTPEVAVISPDGALLYRGRIDDRNADYGKQRAQPTHRDLQDTLEAIVSGRPVRLRTTKTIGCYLRTGPL